MKIVFRVDSSTKMGVGHLMRCLTLADELNSQNHQITFICRNLTGNLIVLIRQKKYKIITIPIVQNFTTNNIYLEWLGATQEYDAEQTIRVLPKNVDLLIVDSYALDVVWHQRLRKFTKKIMVIDDLADRGFDCDTLLNQNLGAQKKDYKGKVPNDCELLLGCDYALLRPEFPNLRNTVLGKRKNTKEVKNILISLGGSDEQNRTYGILKEIPNNLNIVVVLGGSSPYSEMIKKYTKDKESIKVIIGADNMAELMLNADLAIGAGGSTSWERCCLGLPTLLYITANNQKSISENLEQIGAVKIVSNLKDDLHNILNNFSIWRVMSERAQTVCDGIGVKRIKI
jgi:UDP-2,4-diacetamido-2,4,6-trideoxy-beta-L-altropyranose hydrolase